MANNLMNDKRVSLHPSTKVFKGLTKEVELQAKKFAQEVRSYTFLVYNEVHNEFGRKVSVLYGYGIPK